MLIALYIPIIFSSIVIGGWVFQIDLMKQVWLPSVAMNPATACCLLLLSTGLLLKHDLKKRVKPFSIFLLLSAGIIGGFKLLDLIFDTHFGIDTILFYDQIILEKIAPSRMAPNSALCIIILSIASVILSIQSSSQTYRVVLLQLMVISAMLSPSVAILGYGYGIANLYQVSKFIAMAIPTALSIISLSIYLLILTGKQAIMAPIRDSGASGKTVRFLLPVSIIFPALIGWLRIQGERAGLFNLELGVALMVTFNIITFTILIWWHAHRLLISDRLRSIAEADLAHAATHDFLTGLANRSMFMKSLTSRVAEIQRRDHELFGVIFLDADGFKQVNDQLGHDAGDQLLRQISEILHKSVRSEDLVARLGGDEFTVLLDRIDNADDIKKVTARIYDLMPKSIKNVPVGLSMGIVIGNKRHIDPEALLHEADSALYAVKNSGKGRALFYESQMA